MDAQNSFTSKLRFVLISALLAVLAVVGGVGTFRFLASLRKPPERASFAKGVTAVVVVTAKREDFCEQLSGYGTVRALQNTEVEPEVFGVVRWISPNLEAGGTVAEGEELVRLDDRDLRRTLTTAEAGLTQANAAVEALQVDLINIQKQLTLVHEEFAAATRELTRLQGLEKSKQVSSSVVDAQIVQASLRERAVVEAEWQKAAKQPALERARAEIAIRTAQLGQAQNDLARSVIHAPYTGRIEARYVQLGARVIPGKPLFRLVDLSRVEVAVSLGASHFGEVTTGAQAVLRLREEGDVVWQGTVARLAPTVNTSDRTFLAYLEVANRKDGTVLPPGTFVLAQIQGRVYKNVIAIPRSAFLEEKVFIAQKTAPNGEATVKERTPKIHKFLSDTLLVEEGIEPGEEVILTSLEEIGEGGRVRVINATFRKL